jgi:protein-S-isoprenylcysteine O-methyltransferase Ste14
MAALLNLALPGLWMILFIVWGLAAFRDKETQQSEQKNSRIVHLIMILLSFTLTLTGWLRFAFLGWRFLPPEPGIMLGGILIEAVGIGFAIMARLYLGQNWSGTITIKVDHQLIDSGPYSLVRHPIYTGITLAMIGSAIACGEVRGLVGIALIMLAYWRKINLEEQFLCQHFGSQYNQYCRRVKAFIPFIW